MKKGFRAKLPIPYRMEARERELEWERGDDRMGEELLTEKLSQQYTPESGREKSPKAV